jgi:hypothetical protein
MAETIIESPAKLPSEAVNREEYKLIRAGQKVPPTEQATTQPGDTGSESATVSETVEETTQEQQAAGTPEKPKRDRSLEGRVSELRAAGKHAEADKILRDAWTKQERERADKAERELQELRTRKPAEPSEQPKPHAPAPAPASAGDPPPDQKDYDGSEGKTYEDYLTDKAAYKIRQQDQQRAQQQQQQTVRDSVNRKLAAARQAHADFDAVTAGDAAQGTGFLLTPAMQRFLIAHDQGAEILYKLATSPEDHRRIATLHPDLQIAELGILAHGLAAPAAIPPPEKPKPTASRVPAPAPRAGGAESPAPKNPSEARSRDEYKQLRAKQRGR